MAISYLRRAASNSRLKSKSVSLLYHIEIPVGDLTKEDLSKLCKGGLAFIKLDTRKKNAVGTLTDDANFCVQFHSFYCNGWKNI